MCRLVTCETWVSRLDYYKYACGNQHLIPDLLIDRSMCQEPFLDQFQKIPSNAEPIISGLCRGLSNRLVQWDIVIYITKVPKSVLNLIYTQGSAQQNQINSTTGINSWYLGVAILQVNQIVQSHALAAKKYQTPRQFVSLPSPTLYPPNLAHYPNPSQTTDRSASVSYTGKNKRKIGTNATPNEYNQNYNQYKIRQKSMVKKGLPVAFCSFLSSNPFANSTINNPRPLNPKNASLINPNDWGGKRMNVNGLCLNQVNASNIILKFENLKQ